MGICLEILVDSFRSFEFRVVWRVCEVTTMYRDWQVWSDNVVFCSISPSVCSV